jgi:hypothetical protein
MVPLPPRLGLLAAACALGALAAGCDPKPSPGPVPKPETGASFAGTRLAADGHDADRPPADGWRRPDPAAAA